MTYLIIAIFVVICIGAAIGSYDKNFGAANELRKIRKQNERRR